MAMTKKLLQVKLAQLGDISEEQKKSIVCTLIGHSRIVTMWFGYVSCARCEDQIGDTLGGAYDTSGNVIVGHNCAKCRENFVGFNWRDTFMAPAPFAATQV